MKPVDRKKGHDRLAVVVENTLRKDSFTGTVHILRSKLTD